MKRSHTIYLHMLVIMTLILCGIILYILLFKQSVVPQLAVKGDKGDSGIVDYTKVEQIVDQRIAQLPTPQAGPQGPQGNEGPVGPQGSNGIPGINGKSCSAQQVENGVAIVCEDGTSAIVKNGEDGEDGRTPLLRCNENKNRWEIRYSVDDSWAALGGKNTPCKATTL